MIAKTAKKFDIAMRDLYRGLGIDSHEPESFTAYTTDALLFNDAGHGKLAEKLKAFIEAL